MLKRRPAKVHVWEDFWGERAPERGRRPHQFRQWIAQQARERGLVGELPGFDGARGDLAAEVNRGWWIVKCPDPTCNSAVVANDQHRYFMCVKCGNEANGGQWYRVKFPPQRAQIEARINAAPDWKARFWEPGWTLEYLDLFITTAHRSWTAPQTWVAGQIVDEADLNTDIKDNMLFLKALDIRLLLTASGSIAPATNGASLGRTEGANLTYVTRDYDQTTEEHADFLAIMPGDYGGGNIVWRILWTASAGTPGETVSWEINVGSPANDDVLDAALTDVGSSTDTLLATGDVHVGPDVTQSTALPAANDLLMIRISRDVAADDLAADAQLIAVLAEF